MANTVLKDVVLKLSYDFGENLGKKVIKTTNITAVKMNITDEEIVSFTDLLFALQRKSATVSRVNTVTITN